MMATTASQRMAQPLLDAMYAARPAGSSDLQTDYSEAIAFLQALSGAKLSFLALAGDEGERAQAFVEIVEQLPDRPRYGVNTVRLHHRYRPYRILRPLILASVDERSDPSFPIFWMTRDDDLADLYEQGRSGELDDSGLLGYPPCCTAWHYDVFFARGIEAFVEVAEAGGYPEQAILSMLEDWSPEPSFFLPREFYLAAILRANVQFPHLTHVSCPDCLFSEGSPSAILDKEAASLAAELNPQGLVRLQSWLRDRSDMVDRIVTNRNALINSGVNALEISVRAEDVFRHHARYLLKTLAF